MEPMVAMAMVPNVPNVPKEEGGRITYFKLVFWRFLLVFQGGERGEVEDAPGFHFHQVASLTEGCGRDSSRKTDLAPGGPLGAPGKRLYVAGSPTTGT